MKQQINSRTSYSSWKPKHLKEHRLKINKTTLQMGETLGVSPRMYRYYERGRTPISKAMEFAMKYLVEKEFGKEEFAKLTPFERERMERLRDAIAKELEKGDNDEQFSYIFRMCRQAIKEFDNILSK